MSPCRIVYLRKAQQDLLEIFAYVQADRPQAAENLLKQLDRSIQRLKRFPKSGRLPHDDVLLAKGYRILGIEDYLVFYRLKGCVVQILRVLHGRRRYEFLLS